MIDSTNIYEIEHIKYLFLVYHCVRKTSNVALEIHTRERLKSLGRKGQTYDEIILELLAQSGRDGEALDAGGVGAQNNKK